MEQLLQHGLNALMLGGTYALLGIGLTLIFGIMRVVNFTHGELYAFGAYMMYGLVMKAGVNFFVALGLAIVLGMVLGALLELLLLSRLRGADIDTTMLVMIGAWIALQNAEQLAWTGVAVNISNPFPAAPLVVGPVSVAWNRVFVLAVALLLIFITYRLINHRYEHMLPTLITTNLPTAELRTALGDRVASRLAEMTERVILTGPDRRRTAPAA